MDNKIKEYLQGVYTVMENGSWLVIVRTLFNFGNYFGWKFSS